MAECIQTVNNFSLVMFARLHLWSVKEQKINRCCNRGLMDQNLVIQVINLATYKEMQRSWARQSCTTIPILPWPNQHPWLVQNPSHRIQLYGLRPDIKHLIRQSFLLRERTMVRAASLKNSLIPNAWQNYHVLNYHVDQKVDVRWLKGVQKIRKG
jgi:hypothetical protein